jgi:uncharacterized protein (TIGR03435 family)
MRIPGLRRISLIIATVWFGSIALATSAQTSATPEVSPESAATKMYAFEVASIRPNNSGMNSASAKFLPDGYTAENIGMNNLIGAAFSPTDGGHYGFYDTRLLGMPGWANRIQYNVEAKVADSDVPAFTSKTTRQQMMQTLLADRFHLKAHIETRELPIITLSLAPGGPKLKAATPGNTYASGIRDLPNGVSPAGLCFVTGMGEITGQGASIGALVALLSTPLVERALVIDKTGLTGNYDFKVKWSINETTGQPFPQMDFAPGVPAPPDTLGVSLSTALQEQLGLKLVSTKGPVQILVIDHIEPPTPN